MKLNPKDIDIRRTLERLERLLNAANDGERENQLENRIIRACEAAEKWYKRMYLLGAWQASHKRIKAGQLLRYAQEIIARHKDWQEKLAICKFPTQGTSDVQPGAFDAYRPEIEADRRQSPGGRAPEL